MINIDKGKILNKQDKNNTILVTTLFAILVGLWCIGCDGFTELAPLISDKIGYLESIYVLLEIILLSIISGSIIEKIASKERLLLTETIIACVDCICLLISSITLSWKGLLLSYIIMGITSTLSDPIWGSIMSAYSTNDRQKWLLVNRIYFVIRGLINIISLIVCRYAIIHGTKYFTKLSIILIIFMVLIFIVLNRIDKKIFGKSI